MKTVTLITFSLILTSCATIVPQAITDIDSTRCNLVTKKLTLKAIEHPLPDDCGDIECIIAILAASALYTATTGIISGSIVLVGNTVHWLEKQGSCNDSFLNTSIRNHNQPLLEKEGQLVKLKE